MLYPRKESSSSDNMNKKLGIPSKPNSSTMDRNTVDTPEIEAPEVKLEVVTSNVEPNEYCIATYRPRWRFVMLWPSLFCLRFWKVHTMIKKVVFLPLDKRFGSNRC